MISAPTLECSYLKDEDTGEIIASMLLVFDDDDVMGIDWNTIRKISGSNKRPWLLAFRVNLITGEIYTMHRGPVQMKLSEVHALFM